MTTLRICMAALLAASGIAAAQAPLAPRADEVPSSPLAEAAQRGDAEAVRALLAAGGLDVNAPTRDGTPALHWAARAGDRETAELLIAKGADVNAPNRYGVRPLHAAIEAGDAVLTRRLLDAGADAAALDRAGETPLMIAGRVGEPELAMALLEHGAAVDARDEQFGQTALMIAAREGHLEAARVLVAAGADVDAQTKPEAPPRFIPPSESPEGLSRGAGIIRAGWPDGRGKRFPAGGSKTPLSYATREGQLELARLLVENGASLELADGNGVTPLLNAIVNASILRVNRTGTSDHLKVAQLLLDAGANVNAADWYGETPLWAAVDVRNLELGRDGNDRGVRDEAFALIRRLLEAGADPNARTSEYPHERRFILVVVGSVSWVDLTGQTPFLRAAAAGDVDVMRLLLEHGADPNIATDAGTTPLMVAAGVNWAVAETFDLGAEALFEAVKLAHSLGNDVNAINSMGVAAIHGAANRGANDVIEYLAANGARLDVADAQGRTPLDWAGGRVSRDAPARAKARDDRSARTATERTTRIQAMTDSIDRRAVLRNVSLLAAGAVLSNAVAAQQAAPAPLPPFPGFTAHDIQTSGGVTIHAVKGGSGPPLLLLHGAPQTHHTWRDVAPRLAEEYTVVAADLRGYGDSSQPQGLPDHSNYSKRAMAQDQVDVMRNFGFERFALVGQDRGGRVSHRMALDHPDAVTKAVFIDIVPTYYLYTHVTLGFIQSYPHWFNLVQPSPAGENSAVALQGPANAAPSLAQLEYRRRNATPEGRHAMCEDYRAAASIDLEHDAADLDRRIRCPLNVLWAADGAMDRLYDVLAIWHERARDVTGKGMPGGHNMQEGAPAEVLAELRAFLRG